MNFRNFFYKYWTKNENQSCLFANIISIVSFENSTKLSRRLTSIFEGSVENSKLVHVGSPQGNHLKRFFWYKKCLKCHFLITRKDGERNIFLDNFPFFATSPSSAFVRSEEQNTFWNILNVLVDISQLHLY